MTSSLAEPAMTVADERAPALDCTMGSGPSGVYSALQPSSADTEPDSGQHAARSPSEHPQRQSITSEQQTSQKDEQQTSQMSRLQQRAELMLQQLRKQQKLKQQQPAERPSLPTAMQQPDGRPREQVASAAMRAGVEQERLSVAAPVFAVAPKRVKPVIDVASRPTGAAAIGAAPGVLPCMLPHGMAALAPPATDASEGGAAEFNVHADASSAAGSAAPFGGVPLQLLQQGQPFGPGFAPWAVGALGLGSWPVAPEWALAAAPGMRLNPAMGGFGPVEEDADVTTPPLPRPRQQRRGQPAPAHQSSLESSHADASPQGATDMEVEEMAAAAILASMAVSVGADGAPEQPEPGVSTLPLEQLQALNGAFAGAGPIGPPAVQLPVAQPFGPHGPAPAPAFAMWPGFPDGLAPPLGPAALVSAGLLRPSKVSPLPPPPASVPAHPGVAPRRSVPPQPHPVEQAHAEDEDDSEGAATRAASRSRRKPPRAPPGNGASGRAGTLAVERDGVCLEGGRNASNGAGGKEPRSRTGRPRVAVRGADGEAQEERDADAGKGEGAEGGSRPGRGNGAGPEMRIGHEAEGEGEEGSDAERSRLGRKKPTIAALRPFFAGNIQDAAARLGLCRSALKKVCRQLGFTRWPSRKLACLDKMLETVMSESQYSNEEKQELVIKLEENRAAILQNPNAPISPLFNKLRQSQYKERSRKREATRKPGSGSAPRDRDRQGSESESDSDGVGEEGAGEEPGSLFPRVTGRRGARGRGGARRPQPAGGAPVVSGGRESSSGSQADGDDAMQADEDPAAQFDPRGHPGMAAAQAVALLRQRSGSAPGAQGLHLQGVESGQGLLARCGARGLERMGAEAAQSDLTMADAEPGPDDAMGSQPPAPSPARHAAMSRSPTKASPLGRRRRGSTQPVQQQPLMAPPDAGLPLQQQLGPLCAGVGEAPPGAAGLGLPGAGPLPLAPHFGILPPWLLSAASAPGVPATNVAATATLSAYAQLLKEQQLAAAGGPGAGGRAPGWGAAAGADPAAEVKADPMDAEGAGVALGPIGPFAAAAALSQALPALPLQPKAEVVSCQLLMR